MNWAVGLLNACSNKELPEFLSPFLANRRPSQPGKTPSESEKKPPRAFLMKLSDFDYHLPPELIAQYPAARREDSRMLVIKRSEGRFFDSRFRKLPQLLSPSDMLVINNSRVLAARLLGRRQGIRAITPGKGNPARREHLTSQIEALLVRPLGNGDWEALVRPGQKVPIGERLIFESTEGRPERLEAEVVGRGEYGLRTLRFADASSLERKLRRIGHVPLPPYIRRPHERLDRRRYQTVYARPAGSVAAPTAKCAQLYEKCEPR